MQNLAQREQKPACEKKKKGKKTSACEKVSSGDGRETPGISGVPLNTERNPPVIGLAGATVGCVYLSGSICVQACERLVYNHSSSLLVSFPVLDVSVAERLRCVQ